MTYRVRRGFLCDLERRTQRGKEGWKPECTEHPEKLIFQLGCAFGSRAISESPR